jgi:2-phospho-L-lactate guanylyltransferase
LKAVLIPAKQLREAKQRLAIVLSSEQRVQLVWAMFEDVAAAVNGATAADRIVLLSSDSEMLRRARAESWDVIEEETQESESQSVDRASGLLREAGFRAVLRIPIDVPLLRPEDIDGLLAADLETPNARLVPSRDGHGTNALLRIPPDVFPSRFGPRSLVHHRLEADRAGVPLKVIDNARVAFDLDEIADLRHFLLLGSRTATARYLAASGLVS